MNSNFCIEIAKNEAQGTMVDGVQRWSAKTSPIPVCICHSSQQEIESISCPVESELALWLTLTNRMWLRWHCALNRPAGFCFCLFSEANCYIKKSGLLIRPQSVGEQPTSRYLAFSDEALNQRPHSGLQMMVVTEVTPGETSWRTVQMNPAQIHEQIEWLLFLPLVSWSH